MADLGLQHTPRVGRGSVPRWTEEPVPWLAAVLVASTAAGSLWVATVDVVWVGTVAMWVVAALAGGRTGGPVAILAATALLGSALGAPRTPAPQITARSVIQGEVTEATAWSAVVEHPDGPTRVRGTPPMPEVGATVSARVRPSRPGVRLPGAPDPDRADEMMGRGQARMDAWIALGRGVDSVEVPSWTLSSPHGGLLWALASGHRDQIDPAAADLLKRTGTGHLLAISGLHVGLVAGLVLGAGLLVLRGLGRFAPDARLPSRLLWVPTLAAVGSAVLYADQVGWPVSTRRAVAMVAVAAGARMLGRRVRPWSVLGMAAIVVVVCDPQVVHGLGFGLSFGAVLGMLTVAPRLTRWLPPDVPRALRWTAEGLAVSLGALAGTVPLTAWWFQSISPLSPIANLVAGPLVGGVAVPAALVAVHGPVALQEVALALGGLAIEGVLVVLSWLDLPPWAPAVGPMGALALFAALWVRRHAMVAVVAVGGVLWAAGSVRAGDAMELTLLSVGQGDAIFIRLPDGRRWLVDGGPPSDRVVQWLRREGHTHLDTVFLTHPDSDHLGGLEPVLAELDVDRFVTPRPPLKDESTYRRVWLKLFDRGVQIHPLHQPLEGPAHLLHPTPGWRQAAGETGRARDNDDSLVLLLEHAGRRILLTGDIEEAAEQWLAPQIPPVDLIQAPHHGSRTSSSAGLVVAANPDWVVLSCGAGNRYGHPHAATLAQWRGRRLVRTDRHGTLRIRVSEAGIQVEQVRSWGHNPPLSPRPWRPRPP